MSSSIEENREDQSWSEELQKDASAVELLDAFRQSGDVDPQDMDLSFFGSYRVYDPRPQQPEGVRGIDPFEMTTVSRLIEPHISWRRGA